jgi:hypothetical protein
MQKRETRIQSNFFFFFRVKMENKNSHLNTVTFLFEIEIVKKKTVSFVFASYNLTRDSCVCVKKMSCDDLFLCRRQEIEIFYIYKSICAFFSKATALPPAIIIVIKTTINENNPITSSLYIYKLYAYMYIIINPFRFFFF